MELEKDEHIILNDGILGRTWIVFWKKLTRTNKRLIVQKGKGFFKVSWKIEEEIPLEEIEEAYHHVHSFTNMSELKLTLKNDRTKDVRFRLGDSRTYLSLNVKSITDRWVHAINGALRRKE